MVTARNITETSCVLARVRPDCEERLAPYDPKRAVVRPVNPNDKQVM